MHYFAASVTMPEESMDVISVTSGPAKSPPSFWAIGPTFAPVPAPAISPAIFGAENSRGYCRGGNRSKGGADRPKTRRGFGWAACHGDYIHTLLRHSN